MRDRPVIYFGLLLFIALATFPLWRNLASGATTKGPGQSVPVKAKQCVAPTAYMKASHMKFLTNWRDEAVRLNTREYTAFDGKTYTRSLTKTCLDQCHASKADFCDRCHNYAAVSVACWDCHLDAKPALRASRSSR